MNFKASWDFPQSEYKRAIKLVKGKRARYAIERGGIHSKKNFEALMPEYPSDKWHIRISREVKGDTEKWVVLLSETTGYARFTMKRNPYLKDLYQKEYNNLCDTDPHKAYDEFVIKPCKKLFEDYNKFMALYKQYEEFFAERYKIEWWQSQEDADRLMSVALKKFVDKHFFATYITY